MSLKERLKAARERLFQLMHLRHDAPVGSKERKELAEKVVKARAHKDELLEKIKERKPAVDGTVVIDGKQVAAWIAHYVLEARRRGLWHGYVVSGYRSPEYSESLCYQMCGAPSCPGRCAGRASAHSQLDRPNGAVDVDLAHRNEFAAAMVTLGSPLKNALPNDPNHFSYTGH